MNSRNVLALNIINLFNLSGGLRRYSNGLLIEMGFSIGCLRFSSKSLSVKNVPLLQIKSLLQD